MLSGLLRSPVTCCTSGGERFRVLGSGQGTDPLAGPGQGAYQLTADVAGGPSHQDHQVSLAIAPIMLGIVP